MEEKKENNDDVEILNINEEKKKILDNEILNSKNEEPEKVEDKKENEINNKEEGEMAEEIPKKKKERSPFSLEGAKYPLSIYTRRVMNISKIKDYLNEDSSSGICGGINLGNTCFMNSSIACLSNCTELTYYFLCGDYKNDINYENDNGLRGEIAESWGELLQQYWVENTHVGRPVNFKETMGKKDRRFKGYYQQDSNEFMSIFLDNLNEDLNLVSKKEYIELSEEKENESDEQCSKRFWELNLKRNDSIITDLFCGQFKSTVTCPKCNMISITFEPFYSINLPIKENKKKNKNLFIKEDLEEYKMFYIPKYGIRNSYIIKFFDIPNTTKAKECFEILKKEETFKYNGKISKVNYMKIDEKQFEKELDENQIIYKNNYIFLFEIINEEKNYIKLPIYFLYKDDEGEDQLSQYPRFATGSLDMTLEDLKRTIYLNIRKYILSPFIKEGEEIDEISDKINKYIKDMTIEDEYIYDLIEKEYQKIFSDNPSNEDIEHLKSYIQDIPFKLTLRELLGERTIKFLNDDNLNMVSNEFKELTDISSLQKKVGDCLSKISDYVFVVEFNDKSKYINKNNFRLNYCLIKKIQFPKKEEVKEEEKEEEYHKPNLVECLNYFCQEEQLKKGNDWYCKKCKDIVLPKKKMDIYYLPKILIICFKRFIKESFRWEKNEEDIDFPINNFDMKDLIIGPDKEHSVYDLFAVSQHYGSTGFGHYTAVCKNGDNWYKYDDSSVTKTSPSSALNSAAYVLFYRRQTD